MTGPATSLLPSGLILSLQDPYKGISGQLESVLESFQAAIDSRKDTLVPELLEEIKGLRQDLIQQGMEPSDLVSSKVPRGGVRGQETRNLEMMEKIEFLETMIMAQQAEGFDIPRHCCILPPWAFDGIEGLSPAEQNPLNWMQRLREWQQGSKEGTGLFTMKTHLFLVCAHTFRLVPCGPKGQGYVIRQMRSWVRGTARLVSLALQMTCATLGALGAAELPSTVIGEAVGAALELTEEAALSELRKQAERMILSNDTPMDQERGVTSPRPVRSSDLEFDKCS